MKFLCTGCEKMVELEHFRTDGATLVVTCTRCGAESRSAAAISPSTLFTPTPDVSQRLPIPRLETSAASPRPSKAVTHNPFEAPDGHCPKCISRRVWGAPACPNCGLVFSQSLPETFSPSEALKATWLELLGDWENDGRHESLRSAGVERGELAEVGRLYRLRLAFEPNDVRALKGRDEVLRLAMLPQLSLTQRKAEPSEPSKWKYVALAAVIVGCLVMIFFLMRRLLSTPV